MDRLALALVLVATPALAGGTPPLISQTPATSDAPPPAPPACTLPATVTLTIKSFDILQGLAFDPNFKRRISAQDFEDGVKSLQAEITKQCRVAPH